MPDFSMDEIERLAQAFADRGIVRGANVNILTWDVFVAGLAKRLGANVRWRVVRGYFPEIGTTPGHMLRLEVGGPAFVCDFVGKPAMELAELIREYCDEYDQLRLRKVV